ncbi:MAG: 5-formyltetrahydrofolate cyclo-ligase [Hyphomonadaceae bacterium]
MADFTDLEGLKAAARRHARANRAEHADPRACLMLIEHFPLEIARLSPVGGYWPVGAEMDPRPLMAALAKVGGEIALPRVERRNETPRFLLWRGDEGLSADAYGVPSPPAANKEVEPKLLLVPLLAFDRAGRRLGQGGGIYDRVLAALKPKGVKAVGCAYASQEMDIVPTGPFDETLDWIVTEREAIRCGS